MTEPIDPFDPAFEVRCPKCGKLHARRAPNSSVRVTIAQHSKAFDERDPGIVMHCRCGSFLHIAQDHRKPRR